MKSLMSKHLGAKYMEQLFSKYEHQYHEKVNDISINQIH